MRSPLILILLVGLIPLTIFALIVAGSGSGLVLWQPPTLWASYFGTPNGSNGVTALTADASGLYLTGYISDASFLNSSLFVARYDFSGHQVWTQGLGDSDHYPDIGTITAGTDGVYTGGVLNGIGFIGKFDLNGNQVWTRQFDGPTYSEPTGVSVKFSRVIVAGNSASNLTRASQVLLREYDLQGNLVWTHGLGNSTGEPVSVYASGNGVYVTGSLGLYNPFVREYDLNGTLLWNNMLNPSPVFPCACTISGVSGDTSGIVIAGTFDVSPLRGDAFIRKYDLNGNQFWTVQLSSPNYTGFDRIGISTNPSGIYLSMPTGNGAVFLTKHDWNGNSQWSFQIQPLRHLYSPSLPIAAGEAGVYVGGVNYDNSGAKAYVAAFSHSNSLILFGVNPPFSFVMVGSIAGAVAVTILFLRRRRVRFGSKTMSHGSTSLRKVRQPGV
jgi:hypothetical protein